MTLHPPPLAVASAQRRRVLFALLLLVVAVVAGVFGWRWWRERTAPAPPAVALAEIDPALAQGIETAQQKVRQDPYSVAAWGQLGKLLRAAAFVEPAVDCFVQAERLDPENPRWPYLRGEALVHADPDTALPHLQRAVELCKRGDTDNLAPRLRLAEVLMARGRYEEAKAQLDAALNVEPANPSVHLDLGLLAYAQDDLPASREHLLRCLHSPFTQQKANVHLAAIFQRLGDARTAAEYNRRAETLPRDVHWIDPYVMEYVQLGVGKPSRFKTVERLEAQGQFQEAVHELRQMAAESPDYRVHASLGRNLAQIGDYAGAEQALQVAIQLAPDNAQAYYYLSKVLWVRGEQQRNHNAAQAAAAYRAAVDAAGQALLRKPDHGLAHMMLGLALKSLDQRAEALTALRTAVRCNPEIADPHLYLGETLAEDGQLAEALASLRRAAELAKPGDARAAAALARIVRPAVRPW